MAALKELEAQSDQPKRRHNVPDSAEDFGTMPPKPKRTTACGVQDVSLDMLTENAQGSKQTGNDTIKNTIEQQRYEKAVQKIAELRAPSADSFSWLQSRQQVNPRPSRATELESLISHEARRRRRIETQGDGQGEGPVSETDSAHTSWTPRLMNVPSDKSFQVFPASQVLPPSQASLFPPSRASVN